MELEITPENFIKIQCHTMNKLNFPYWYMERLIIEDNIQIAHIKEILDKPCEIN